MALILTEPQQTALLALLGKNTDARIVVLEKQQGIFQENHTAPEPPETPDLTYTKAGKHYQFTGPSFTYNKKTYLSSEVMENQEENESVLDALIDQQTDAGVFYPGILIEVEEPVS